LPDALTPLRRTYATTEHDAQGWAAARLAAPHLKSAIW